MITPSTAAIAGCVLLGVLLSGAILGWWAWQQFSRLRDDLSRWEQWP